MWQSWRECQNALLQLPVQSYFQPNGKQGLRKKGEEIGDKHDKFGEGDSIFEDLGAKTYFWW